MGEEAPEQVVLLGNGDLLNRPSLALFCSRKYPGSVILQTYDLMKELRQREEVTVIGGFQSPMERECLHLLLKGVASVIVCPARAIEKFRIPADCKPALEGGRLLYLSPFVEKPRRPTAQTALFRNRFVAALAEVSFVAYASVGGTLESLSGEIAGWGRQIYTHDDEHTVILVKLGARVSLPLPSLPPVPSSC
ncbi:MAG: hypothetical protein AUJ92_10220 [Armatimonadetes bacterium CG2_30_59_28]|nr:MAG: hypothetical protein AUJ92_10220 [Armatimonadetes bacterium CG2_30_59_28]